MPPAEQLLNKYLLSIEGNDVSSGLKVTHPINRTYPCSVLTIIELNRSHHILCHLSSVDVIFEFGCIVATYTV